MLVINITTPERMKSSETNLVHTRPRNRVLHCRRFENLAPKGAAIFRFEDYKFSTPECLEISEPNSQHTLPRSFVGDCRSFEIFTPVGAELLSFDGKHFYNYGTLRDIRTQFSTQSILDPCSTLPGFRSRSSHRSGGMLV